MAHWERRRFIDAAFASRRERSHELVMRTARQRRLRKRRCDTRQSLTPPARAPEGELQA
jgi:hypothetical protein